MNKLKFYFHIFWYSSKLQGGLWKLSLFPKADYSDKFLCESNQEYFNYEDMEADILHFIAVFNIKKYKIINHV